MDGKTTKDAPKAIRVRLANGEMATRIFRQGTIASPTRHTTLRGEFTDDQLRRMKVVPAEYHNATSTPRLDRARAMLKSLRQGAPAASGVAPRGTPGPSCASGQRARLPANPIPASRGWEKCRVSSESAAEVARRDTADLELR